MQYKAQRLYIIIIQQVAKFRHLGSLITSDGRSVNEIKIRIARAKTAFQDLSTILRNKYISMKTRKRVLECYIPILTYRSESWAINNAAVNVINAAEMWFLRKVQRLSYIDRITNEEVLRRAETGRKLCVKVRERHKQDSVFGHVMRRSRRTGAELEHHYNRGDQRNKEQRKTTC